MSAWAEPDEKCNATVERYTEMVEEVNQLLNLKTSLDCLHPSEEHNTKAMNDKLQDILDHIEDHPSDELCAWIRYTANWKKMLPAWDPLRLAAIAQALTRNSEQWVDQAFVGLKPGSRLYDYNFREDK